MPAGGTGVGLPCTAFAFAWKCADELRRARPDRSVSLSAMVLNRVSSTLLLLRTEALVSRVLSPLAFVAVKMARRQGATRECIHCDTRPRSNADAGPFSQQPEIPSGKSERTYHSGTRRETQCQMQLRGPDHRRQGRQSDYELQHREY